MPPLSNAFGRICREGRLHLDVSQGELAQAADISVAYISLIELGRANPTLAVVQRISHALGLDLDLVPRSAVVIGARQRDFVHARCTAYVHRRLLAAGLLCEREVAIVDGRARGWIDILAFDQTSGTLIVIEVKTVLDDLGAVERQLGWYERQAPAVARRLGWPVRHVRAWLLVLASGEADAAVRAHRDLVRLVFPTRARAMHDDLRGRFPGPARAGASGTDRSTTRGLALIDPASRRRAWLIPSRVDGRRRAAPYRDYSDAALRLRRGEVEPKLPNRVISTPS